MDLASSSDSDLMRGCAKRSQAAMEELTRRYQPKLYRFLMRMLASPEDAEEAVIDVFVRVWQQAGRFEGRASVATWVYRIAANVAYDTIHRRKTRPQTAAYVDDRAAASDVVDVEEAAIASVHRTEQAAVLQRALEALSPGDRMVLVLYYVEEMGYDEIKDVLHISYPVLKTRLMRARQRLKSALATRGAEIAS